MGISSSNSIGVSIQDQEGQHFQNLLQSKPLSNAIVSKDKSRPPKSVNPTKISINTRARILLRLNTSQYLDSNKKPMYGWDILWDTFLASNNQSFAISSAEARLALRSALFDPNLPNVLTEKTKEATINQEIDDYINLVTELTSASIVTSKSATSAPVVIDFMAILSSCLLFSSEVDIEYKIDKLFFWIALDPSPTIDQVSFDFDAWHVALTSFERGASHALGYPSCSEAFVRNTATAWFSLILQSYKLQNTVSNKQFFDFATNRQHGLRRLLESFSESTSLLDLNPESVDTYDLPKKSRNTGVNFESPTMGDQWLANPAWKKTAELMTPEGVVDNNRPPSESLVLNWCHGYRGYDCRNNIYSIPTSSDSTVVGSFVVFFAAALVIAQGKFDKPGAKETQAFFSLHSDDVISLAVSPIQGRVGGGGKCSALIASGEVGKKPSIHLSLWSADESKEIHSIEGVASINGFHAAGIAQLAFSSDGKRLISFGLEYSVAIYHACDEGGSIGKMICSLQGPKDKIMHVSSAPYVNNSSLDFVSCGEKHVILWKGNSNQPTYQQLNCKLGAYKSKNILCAVSLKGGVAVGTSDGDILLLQVSSSSSELGIVQQSKSSPCLGCHSPGGVTCMWSSQTGENVISGGKDGKIIIWKVASSQNSDSTSVSLTMLGQPSTISTSPLRALSLSNQKNELYIGTSSCEIVSITASSRSSLSASSFAAEDSVRHVVVCGHYKEELWGLAPRPRTSQYVTVGDDAFLRLWESNPPAQICAFPLGQAGRCCEFSMDGTYLAVGLGITTLSKGKNTSKNLGTVRVYRTDSLFKSSISQPVVAAEINESKGAISVVKFSPDGSTLAVGSRDGGVYLYASVQQFKRKAKFAKHNSGILSLDFSADGKYLQSTCSAYEILFCDIATGSQVFGTALKNIEWHTWTSSLGWPVVGIWSGTMDGSDINTVDRSPNGSLIVTGDDFSKVNLYRYPAVHKGGNSHLSFSGHSSHVTCVKWLLTGDDNKKKLISTGGEDKTVLVWDLVNGGGGFSSAKGLDGVDSTSVDDIQIDITPGGGDEFLAVKPWLGAIVAPSAWATPDPSKIGPWQAALTEYATLNRQLIDSGSQYDEHSKELLSYYHTLKTAAEVANQRLSESGYRPAVGCPPSGDLSLEYVHGYRGDLRNNVYVVKVGQNDLVLYPAASMVVITPSTKRSINDTKERTQTYFRGHSDDVLSLCVYIPTNLTDPPLAASGQQGLGSTFVWEIGSLKTRAVLKTKQKSCIMLSFSAEGRYLASLGGDSSITVSDWKSGVLLASTQLDGGSPYHICSYENSQSTSDSCFIISGDKYVKTYSLSGKTLTSNRTISSKTSPRPQQFLSCVSIPGTSTILIGAEDGKVHISIDGGKNLTLVFDHHGSIPMSNTSNLVSDGKTTNKSSEKKSKSSGKAVSNEAYSKGGVTAMTYIPALGVLATGAKNGTVCLWSYNPISGKSELPSFLTSFDISTLSGLSSIFAKQITSLSIIPNSFGSVNKLYSSGDPISLIVGTRGCDLVKVDISNCTSSSSISLGDVIVRGHCNDEVWGLATHPFLPQYVTTGDDKTLRAFSLRGGHRQIAAVPLGLISRCCSYNSDGNILALGFGGRVGKGKEDGGGVVRLYSAEWTQNGGHQLAERHDAKLWISDVKFSRDGKTLVAAAHDCKIYIYDVEILPSSNSSASKLSANLNLRSTFTKHNAVLNHVDLSYDGRFMQSTCSAYELLFSDVSTGKQIVNPSELKDVKWDSWTCPLGWPVQGIWAPGMDGSDINAVSRSHAGHIIATADDKCNVTLHAAPCLALGGAPVTYCGHSSHVSNVRWSVGDEFVLSCGGADRCIFVWKHTATIGGSSTSDHSSGRTDSEAGDSDEFSLSDSNVFDVPSGGDESLAVKPWLGAIRPPKCPPPISKAAPNVQMSLSWVYGYTSSAVVGSSTGNSKQKTISNNAFFNSNGALVYPAASLGVILSNDAISQTYFRGHDDDILCLCISHNRRIVATGQTASLSGKGKAGVCLWDAADGRLLSSMPLCHQRGVSLVSFSYDDKYLLSVGLDDNNTHILWEDVGGSWSKVQKTAEEKGDKGSVLFAHWLHPTNKLVSSGNGLFVSGGSSGSGALLTFWSLQGAKLVKKAGRLNPKGNTSKSGGPSPGAACLCSASLSGKLNSLVVGSSSGALISFGEGSEALEFIENAHIGAVTCIAETPPSYSSANSSGDLTCSWLISGGRDGCLKVWSQTLQPLSTLNLDAFSSIDSAVCSLDSYYIPQSSGKSSSYVLKLLVGTLGGDLLQVTTSYDGSSVSGQEPKGTGPDISGSVCNVSSLMQSHSKGELWGVAPHPVYPEITATVGDDSTLRIWMTPTSPTGTHKMIGLIALSWPGRSCAWHPSGGLIAVGHYEAPRGNSTSKTSKKSSSKRPGALTLYSVAVDINNFSAKIVKVCEGGESQAWIQDVKFTPDGNSLAVCSHDKKMYMYTVPGESGLDAAWHTSNALTKPRYVFNKHSSAILAIDFSTDGQYWQTNCQAGELLYGAVSTGHHETSATKLANLNNLPGSPDTETFWASQTCKLGWSVQGLWTPGLDLSDINAVDRNQSWNLAVAGYDDGTVKLARFPIIATDSSYVVGRGHSSHVTNVRWTASGNVVSVGGNDKCLFLWEITES